MALSERERTARIIVDEEDNIIVVRTTVISRDGDEIARQTKRQLYSPGDDVSSEPPRVRNIAKVVWTANVIAAFQARKEAEKAELLAQLKRIAELERPTI